MTADDIKDYIIYAVEPAELCELLGYKTCLHLARRIRAEHVVMGFDEQQDFDIEELLDGLV